MFSSIENIPYSAQGRDTLGASPFLTQEEIDAEATASKNEALWGKPANDIINGRDTAAQYKPVRAIWEMVQNARDVNGDRCSIEFYRKQDSFVFRHDGLPFTNPTLDALILQTSSKVRDDIEQVGQYGTGFLTTHRLGRAFLLSGSLQLKAGVEQYCHFEDFLVDRTPNIKVEMVKSLARQFEAKDKLLKRPELRHLTPTKWTTFTYKQPNDIERENAEECFEKSPELIPYVMCLNGGIKSITFIDELKISRIGFENVDSQPIETAQDYIAHKTIINVINNGIPEDRPIEVFSLDSIETITTAKGKVLPKVTVILPVRNDKVFSFGVDVPRLFLYLPMIGTEAWGVNFIINSPVFTCATENRSSLRFVHDGQGDKKVVELNQEAIKLATQLVFAYLKLHVGDWNDVKELASIAFDTHSSNEQLCEFYKNLKAEWLQQMSCLPLVDVIENETAIRKAAIGVYVVDSSLADAISEDYELLAPIYNVLCRMHPSLVPTAEHLVYWSKVFSKWYEGETCGRIVTLADIVGYIHTNGLSVVNEPDLLKICTYINTSGQTGFFDKNILVTEDGALTNQKEGLKPADFNSVLKASVKVLLPEKANKFVKPSFSALATAVSEFGVKDVKESLASCVDIIQTTRTKVLTDATRTAWNCKQQAYKPDLGKLLSEAERNALMSYCRLIIPTHSEAFEAKALMLVAEYYSYNFGFQNSLLNCDLEWRGAIRLLLNNVLLEFTLLEETSKEEKSEWILRLIEAIYGYSDFKSMLKNYRCYKSQTEAFRYVDELSRDSSIPEKMKGIYNAIFSTKENKVNVHDRLFETAFGLRAETEKVEQPILFGNQIMAQIIASNKYFNDIDTYEHKDLIMDIINMFEHPTEGNLWRSAFETIYKDIPSLLTKLVLNAENREPMIRIMKVKDTTRLKKAADIIVDEHLFDIWELGKKAWTQKLNEKTDFEKKKELGKYVEDYLRKELSKELARAELVVDVNDEQSGQDIVVRINGEAVYYVEVKSRWVVADSVMMSALQLEQSVSEKNHYSLFAVDMTGYNGENVAEHKYPETIGEFTQRIKVITNIGTLNEDILPSKRDANEQVHIGGDYKAVVPQNLINKTKITYEEFIEKVLKPCVAEYCNRIQS